MLYFLPSDNFSQTQQQIESYMYTTVMKQSESEVPMAQGESVKSRVVSCKTRGLGIQGRLPISTDYVAFYTCLQ